jgi:8-oxoguanine deaminase
MPSLLVKNADLLVTMDEKRRCFHDGGLFIRDHVIEQVGSGAEMPAAADRVIDARGMAVLPGLINTHHHLFQTLTRAVPAAQDATLFQWLKVLYPVWSGITPEAIHSSALIGMAELMLSGCTTTSDHLYLYPDGCRIDDEIRAARETGIRFHAARGSMSLGESRGGLPPDRLVENEEFILSDTRRAIETYHDGAPISMLRIVVAPCSPFSVSRDLMKECAALARAYRVRLHTHLAETRDEEQYCQQQCGSRPFRYAEELDWTGEDVWYAHAVHMNPAEIAAMARTGTGMCHCPTSNMRLGSGIAPVRACLDAGVPLGLGVDGSASNDSSHLLAEARMALLLQRVSGNPAGLSAAEALWLATAGGARVLGRDDIGQLAPGKAADLIGVRLHTLDFAGALHDPQAALVFCAPQRVDFSIINGRVVIEEGRLLTVDLVPAIERHNRLARNLLQG